MATLTAVGAWVRLPLPYVPLTLQVLFVCLAGVWLGPWRGALSQGVYLVTGLIGFPVFARGGGLHYLFEPSFGYLLGFVPAAFITGSLGYRASTYPGYLLAIYAGMASLYALGVGYLYLNLTFLTSAPISLPDILKVGLMPLPKDLALGLLAAHLACRIRRPPPHDARMEFKTNTV